MSMLSWIKASYARAPGSWLFSGLSASLFAIVLVLHFIFGVGR